MNGFNASFLIELNHFGPVDTSVFNVNFCLHAEHSCNARLHQSLCILLSLGVRTKKNIGIANLVKSKSSNKVCINFLNVTVYKENLVNVPPLQMQVLVGYSSVILVL